MGKIVLPEFMEKSTEEQLEGEMSPTEKKEFVTVVRAMSDEEKLLVVKAMPNEVLLEELGRRLTIATETLCKVKNVISGQDVV